MKDVSLLHSQQVRWVRAFTGGIQELQAYVKKYHTTGLVWNKEVYTFPHLYEHVVCVSVWFPCCLPFLVVCLCTS